MYTRSPRCETVQTPCLSDGVTIVESYANGGRRLAAHPRVPTLCPLRPIDGGTACAQRTPPNAETAYRSSKQNTHIKIKTSLDDWIKASTDAGGFPVAPHRGTQQTRAPSLRRLSRFALHQLEQARHVPTRNTCKISRSRAFRIGTTPIGATFLLKPTASAPRSSARPSRPVFHPPDQCSSKHSAQRSRVVDAAGLHKYVALSRNPRAYGSPPGFSFRKKCRRVKVERPHPYHQIREA